MIDFVFKFASFYPYFFGRQNCLKRLKEKVLDWKVKLFKERQVNFCGFRMVSKRLLYYKFLNYEMFRKFVDIEQFFVSVLNELVNCVGRIRGLAGCCSQWLLATNHRSS